MLFLHKKNDAFCILNICIKCSFYSLKYSLKFIWKKKLKLFCFVIVKLSDVHCFTSPNSGFYIFCLWLYAVTTHNINSINLYFEYIESFDSRSLWEMTMWNTDTHYTHVIAKFVTWQFKIHLLYVIIAWIMHTINIIHITIFSQFQ